MPITAKITFIFNAGKQGWSEVWYWTGSDLSTASARALDVASARKGLLGSGSVLEAIRVSDEAIRNDSIISFDAPVPAGAVTQTAIRDTPGNAWLCRIQSTPQYRRQQWLRGIPDSWIVWDPATGKYTKLTVMTKAFEIFRDALIAKAFQIRALDRNPLVNPVVPISAITADTSGVYKITAAGHGLSNLQYIRIRGAKGTNVKGFNTVWQIFSPTVNDFLIPAQVVAGVPVFYVGGGLLQRRAISYFTIDGGELLRPAIRKTGRAFFVPAGRRKARV